MDQTGGIESCQGLPAVRSGYSECLTVGIVHLVGTKFFHNSDQYGTQAGG